MAVCEQCHSTFDPADLPTELSTTRLLCKPCYERRQLEKTGRFPVVSSKPSSASSSTRAAAPQRPAAAPEPKTATIPPSSRVDLTASKRGSLSDSKHGDLSATKRIDVTASKHGDLTASKHGDLSGSKHGDLSASKSGIRSGRHGPVHKDEKQERLKELSTADQPVMNRTTKIGFVVTLIFFAAAGGAWFYQHHVKELDRIERERVERERNAFVTRVGALDPTNYDQAVQAVTMITEGSQLWRNTDASPKIQAILSSAQRFIESEQNKKALTDRLTALETDLADAKNKTAAEVKELINRASGLVAKKDDFDAAGKARIDSCVVRLQNLYVSKLVDEAKAFADANAGDAKGALVKLANAEDEVRRLVDKALKANDTENRKTFEAQYYDLIAKADTISAAFFTDAEVNKTAWRDLLSGDAIAEWRAGAMKGFNYKFENGGLSVSVDESANGKGVLSIGATQQWRDFVIEAEFVLESGSVIVAFRFGANLDNQTDSVTLKADGSPFDPGKPYGFTKTMIGSHSVLTFKDDAATKQEDPEVSKYWNRHGELGLVVPKGSKLRFTKLRIRELR